MQVKDARVVGQLHDPHHAVSFKPSVWHGTEPWKSNHPRVVLLLYTVGCTQKLSPQHAACLHHLGFALPAGSKGGDLVGSRFENKRVGLPPSVKGAVGQGSNQPCHAGSGESSGQDSVQGSDRDSVQGSDQESVQGSGHESFQGWCGLCEEWVKVAQTSDCSQCGCGVQRPCYELQSGSQGTQDVFEKSQNQIKRKKYQKQTKAKKSQNPNENGIILKEKSQLEEAELGAGDPEVTHLEPFGDCIEDWILGPSQVAKGSIYYMGTVDCDQKQVVLMDPADEHGFGSREDERGLGGREHDASVFDELVVDLQPCDDERREAGHDQVSGELGCSVGMVGDSCVSVEKCEVHELDRDRDGMNLVERGGHDVGCGLREVEELDGSAAEELRVLEVISPRQRDIEDFAAWLDESQLRLAAYHEEALQDWIEHGDIQDVEAPDTRGTLNRIWETVEDLRYELRSLCEDQLAEDLGQLLGASPSASDEDQAVLQTRIVANWEIAQQWDLWKPAAVSELDELTVGKGALEYSNLDKLRELESRGFKVIQLPSKLVCTLKAPAGRRKVRLVACGNYMALMEKDKRTHREVVHASATSVEALRTCVSWSVRRGHVLLTADIRAAFLNAQLLPRGRTEAERAAKQEAVGGSAGVFEPEEGAETVVLIPPRLLVSKGLIHPSVRFIVRRPFTGLIKLRGTGRLAATTSLSRPLWFVVAWCIVCTARSLRIMCGWCITVSQNVVSRLH